MLHAPGSRQIPSYNLATVYPRFSSGFRKSGRSRGWHCRTVDILWHQRYGGIPVEIVDTRVTSAGQALVVLAAARAAAQGKSLQEVRQAADVVVQRMHLFFAVDTLEYLHRGGRIGGASRYLGTAFSIKPILYFDSEGKLDALERVRTKGKALQRLIALAEGKANGHPLHLGVIHANAPQVAQEFREQIAQHLHCNDVFTLELSPVISIHVGPGTIGIALYEEY
ncbi:MAG: hypothetical protein CVU40_12155 [Chloroflexi bacterium HGW-Chloroflexi-2]|nr:MAG: hypothetical protein CVU40_12155 [Chloroflexi bacterium HGW-Chloroflexi-2]